MLAIDRDAILSDVFRAGKVDVHKPMTGPFPPKSWANPKVAGGVAAPLVNRDLAFTKLKTYLGDMGAKTDVTLSYPEGDAPAALACWLWASVSPQGDRQPLYGKATRPMCGACPPTTSCAPAH